MLVSIITPCLNSEKTIERTVLSVINQSYNNIQYIIVDGQSLDKTLNILRKYQEIDSRLLVVSEKDNSMTEALNRGLQLAKGSIIATLNADDWYEPNAIEKVVQCYSNHSFDCLMANTRFIGETNKHLYTTKPWLCNWKLSWYLMGCITPESSVFYSSKCIKSVGKFNENVRYTQDLEYYLRILKLFQITYLNEALSNFAISHNQYSAKLHDRMEEEVLSYIQNKILRKYIGGTNLGSLLRLFTGVRVYNFKQFSGHLTRYSRKFIKY